MKIITFLCFLLSWPMMVTAQKIVDFTEMMELSDGNMFLVTVPEGLNYKVTYGSLLTNLSTRLRSFSGNITFALSNTYDVGSSAKPAAYIFGMNLRAGRFLEVRTGDMEGAIIGNLTFQLGTNLSNLGHGIGFRRNSDGAIISGMFSFNDGVTPDLAIQSLGDIAMVNYPGDRLMIIKADGKVGIGTATPTTSLDVTGGVRAASMTIVGTTNQLIFGTTNSAPASVVAPTKWISVQINGEATSYRIPLYN